MRVLVAENSKSLGNAAAASAARSLMRAIQLRGEARMLVSTGASQFDTLDALVSTPVDWSRVTMYHLDEYVGLPASHPASFRRYLRERLLDRVAMREAVLIDGHNEDTDGVIRWLGESIRRQAIDVGLIGIGENAHIAFNDPPADFETTEPYKLVTLDHQCKAQQVREGWFPSVEAVPDQAISMTVHQILQCREIISAVPYAIKAPAIRRTLESDDDPQIPATALKRHPQISLYLDTESSQELSPGVLRSYGAQKI